MKRVRLGRRDISRAICENRAMALRGIIRKLLLRYGSQATVIRTLRAMGVRIGDGCRIYTTNFGNEPWLIRIGDRVCISSDVTFVNHNLTWSFRIYNLTWIFLTIFFFIWFHIMNIINIFNILFIMMII